MTVALGPKGNNLSLGGKVSQVSAEDAYTVCLLTSLAKMIADRLALDDTGLRKGSSLRLPQRNVDATKEIRASLPKSVCSSRQSPT